MTPPLVISYNASSVPILQLGAFGAGTFRTAVERSRAQLHPHPAGDRAGRVGAVSLRRQAAAGDDRPAIRAAMQAQGHFADRRGRARSSAQNLILPSGTAKIGQFEYDVDLNASPKTGRGAERSAGQGSSGNRPSTCATWRTCATALRRRPTSCGRDGQRGALLTILKAGERRRSTSSQERERPAAGDARHAAAGVEDRAAWPISRSSCARRCRA